MKSFAKFIGLAVIAVIGGVVVKLLDVMIDKTAPNRAGGGMFYTNEAHADVPHVPPEGVIIVPEGCSFEGTPPSGPAEAVDAVGSIDAVEATGPEACSIA